MSIAPGITPHKHLNPRLWTDNQLDPRVNKALHKIADKFYKFLNVNATIRDIIITGSQASYNYTKHSDLDLHIIIDYKEVTCDQPVEELLDTKRKLWKLQHDISIHGIPVELYAEDLAKPVTGAAYSIMHGKWERTSKPVTGHLPEGIERTAAAWTMVITDAIRSNDSVKLAKVKTMLMNYRQAGLATDAAELAKPNLVFKTLRNMGVIAMLMQALTHTQDQELSLPD